MAQDMTVEVETKGGALRFGTNADTGKLELLEVRAAEVKPAPWIVQFGPESVFASLSAGAERSFSIRVTMTRDSGPRNK